MYSTYCSSHADPNSPACVAINFLNIIKEEDLFVKLLSLVNYNYVFLPVFGTLWWTVLSTSSIQHEHPLRTLMQISYTYAHMLGRKATNVHSTIKFVPWYIFLPRVFGCDTAFIIVHMHVVWLAVHKKLARTNQPTIIAINDKDFYWNTQGWLLNIFYLICVH